MSFQLIAEEAGIFNSTINLFYYYNEIKNNYIQVAIK